MYLIDLYEEKAVLYGKLGRHEKALLIYVTVIGDIEKAVHYCDRVFKDGKSGSEEVKVCRNFLQYYSFRRN